MVTKRRVIGFGEKKEQKSLFVCLFLWDTTYPDVFALSMHFVILKIALISVTRRPIICTLAVGLIVLSLTNIFPPITVLEVPSCKSFVSLWEKKKAARRYPHIFVSTVGAAMSRHSPQVHTRLGAENAFDKSFCPKRDQSPHQGA